MAHPKRCRSKKAADALQLLPVALLHRVLHKAALTAVVQSLELQVFHALTHSGSKLPARATAGGAHSG